MYSVDGTHDLLPIHYLITLTYITEAHVLPYQDEQLMDKWLMMYLETHPKYQGQDVGQEVFREWKKLLLKTCEV